MTFFTWAAKYLGKMGKEYALLARLGVFDYGTENYPTAKIPGKIPSDPSATLHLNGGDWPECTPGYMLWKSWSKDAKVFVRSELDKFYSSEKEMSNAKVKDNMKRIWADARQMASSRNIPVKEAFKLVCASRDGKKHREVAATPPSFTPDMAAMRLVKLCDGDQGKAVDLVYKAAQAYAVYSEK